MTLLEVVVADFVELEELEALEELDEEQPAMAIAPALRIPVIRRNL
ncbi:MAG TPA: hypothetical protein VMV92_12420 [Streptosporangiaceae bacterium]|nr:hypothetical protein [Streptosporangiaceae bacterium]